MSVFWKKDSVEALRKRKSREELQAETERLALQAEDADEMNVDQEYRLTLLELGLMEV